MWANTLWAKPNISADLIWPTTLPIHKLRGWKSCKKHQKTPMELQGWRKKKKKNLEGRLRKNREGDTEKYVAKVEKHANPWNQGFGISKKYHKLHANNTLKHKSTILRGEQEVSLQPTSMVDQDVGSVVPRPAFKFHPHRFLLMGLWQVASPFLSLSVPICSSFLTGFMVWLKRENSGLHGAQCLVLAITMC